MILVKPRSEPGTTQTRLKPGVALTRNFIKLW